MHTAWGTRLAKSCAHGLGTRLAKSWQGGLSTRLAKSWQGGLGTRLTKSWKGKHEARVVQLHKGCTANKVEGVITAHPPPPPPPSSDDVSELYPVSRIVQQIRDQKELYSMTPDHHESYYQVC